MVMAKNYALLTDAPLTDKQNLLVQAWHSVPGRRKWGSATAIEGGIRCEIHGHHMDFAFTTTATAGTAVSSNVLQTMVSQGKLFLVIPFGAKKVHATVWPSVPTRRRQ